MNIHEYQANSLFRQYGIPAPEGLVAKTAAEAEEAARKLNKNGVWVVKAQVHAGGRGKAGGVKIARSPEEAGALAGEILSKRLVTHQSGHDGAPVEKVFIVNGVEILKEYYIALALDAQSAGLVFIASSRGGMEIEKVAQEDPEAIVRQPVDLAIGVRPYMCANTAEKLGIPTAMRAQFSEIMRAMYRLFVEKDCSMIEINPLAEVAEGLLAVDSKINFENNGLIKHPEILELRDAGQEDPREAEAAKYELNYVGLEGNIGCMVNGAGLAMATMDMIRHFGGLPANFLDVGGGTTEENISGAFRILLADKKVKAVLVNIFGGIMKCDVIALGIKAAAEKTDINVPVIVRLEGTNANEGKRILAESGMSIITEETFEGGVQTAVRLAGGGGK